MKNFNFAVTTQIQFGVGISEQTGAVLKDLIKPGGSNHIPGVLVMVDPGLRKATWLPKVLASLNENGVQYHAYEQIQPNPRDEDIYPAVELVKSNRLEGVLAIGGGSTMDAAKGTALIASHGGKIGDYNGWGQVPGQILPVVTVPTTSGSGSEATCWAVITEARTHNKLALGDPHLAPAVAIIDPALTISLPASITAATGMDALTHSIEAFISPLSSPVNDLMALESIRLVASHLKQAVKAGDDLEARAGMSLAATLGGIAINNADVAGVHCLSEGMGGLYDAPHGLLNAILLPHFMAYWQEGCPERFARIAQAFGAAAQPSEAVSQVSALAQSLKFPALSEIGVVEADLPKLAALAEANVSNPSNPIPMHAADYLAILKQALDNQ